MRQLIYTSNKLFSHLIVSYYACAKQISTSKNSNKYGAATFTELERKSFSISKNFRSKEEKGTYSTDIPCLHDAKTPAVVKSMPNFGFVNDSY